MADARAGVVAAVHAGRVGAQKGVVARAVEAMLRRGRARRGHLGAAGPGGQRPQLRSARGDGREVEAALPGSRTTTVAGHSRAGSAGRNRLAVNGFGRHGDRYRPALHGGRPQSVQSSPRCPDRTAGVGGVDGMTDGAWNDAPVNDRIGRRAGGRCGRGSRGPRRRPAAMPTKLNCCPSPNSFRQPMSLILSRLGCRAFGESREQEAVDESAPKCECRVSGADAPIRWHMVGRIQRNKARSIARLGVRRALGRQRQGDRRAGPGGRRRRWHEAAGPTRCGSTFRSASTATCRAAASTSAGRISSTNCAPRRRPRTAWSSSG